MESLKEEPEVLMKRPKFLLVLCILSFINLALSILTSLFGVISGKPSEEELASIKLQFAESQEQLASLSSTQHVDMSYWSELLKKFELMTDGMYANFTVYNLLILCVSLLAIASVYLMFTGKKIGFHGYILYCFLYVIQSYFFTTPSNVPTFLIVLNLIYGGIWVLMYARNLKWMK